MFTRPSVEFVGRPAVAIDRRCDVAAGPQHVAQHGICLARARAECDRGAQCRYRLVVLTLFVQRRPKTELGAAEIRLQDDRLPQAGNCLRHTAGLAAGQAEVVVRDRTVRRMAHRHPQRRDRIITPALRLMARCQVEEFLGGLAGAPVCGRCPLALPDRLLHRGERLQEPAGVGHRADRRRRRGCAAGRRCVARTLGRQLGTAAVFVLPPAAARTRAVAGSLRTAGRTRRWLGSVHPIIIVARRSGGNTCVTPSANFGSGQLRRSRSSHRKLHLLVGFFYT